MTVGGGTVLPRLKANEADAHIPAGRRETGHPVAGKIVGRTAARYDAAMSRSRILIAMLCAAAALAPPALAAPVSVTTRIEADGSRTLVHEAIVPAAIDRVWQAISTAEGWRSWAVPMAWTSADEPDMLETSYDMADRPGSPGTIRQQFLARIPGRLIVFRTVKAPAGFPHWETYRKVTGIFELEPIAPGETRIRLTSVGYADTAAGRELLGFFERGNAETLESLRRRFVDGPIDWTARPGGAGQ